MSFALTSSEPPAFYSEQNQAVRPLTDEARSLESKFRQFLRQWEEGGRFIYRDRLNQNFESGKFVLEVDYEDLQAFDAVLAHRLLEKPLATLAVLERAIKQALIHVAVDIENIDAIPDFQLLLRGVQPVRSVRQVTSKMVGRIVSMRGIVVSVYPVKAKAHVLKIRCKDCRTTKSIRSTGFAHARIPIRCDAGQPNCRRDPYELLPDQSSYVDIQRIKIQEPHDAVPTGEMPRHFQLLLERTLVNAMQPGNRVSVSGIVEVYQEKARMTKDRAQDAVAIRTPFLRVLGFQSESARSPSASMFTAEDEEELRQLSRDPRIRERVFASIAPSIFGMEMQKKAIACSLFAGSRKVMPSGSTLRGDINVLFLGDPSVAKSQLLKFADAAAPVSVYTSGKGSSAAGLTASVIRDASGEFRLEGGAMVLADGGVVCIDEFDKMRPQDRVAIHEAMEQQTISIAKAGITTVLNSRCSVLAAANPVHGRYDDTAETRDNIDFQTTILSRFDVLFIILDDHEERRDTTLAQHIIRTHQGVATEQQREHDDSFRIPQETLTKYIRFARERCRPRLGVAAMEGLKGHYIKFRQDKASRDKLRDGSSSIPITVRQLEAIVRLSEAFAKMELRDEATEDHVEEAIRLFRAGTMAAALMKPGGLDSVLPGTMTDQLRKEIQKIEAVIRHRVPQGADISTMRLKSDLSKRNFKSEAISYAIEALVDKDEFRFKQGSQRRMLNRL